MPLKVKAVIIPSFLGKVLFTGQVMPKLTVTVHLHPYCESDTDWRSHKVSETEQRSNFPDSKSERKSAFFSCIPWLPFINSQILTLNVFSLTWQLWVTAAFPANSWAFKNRKSKVVTGNAESEESGAEVTSILMMSLQSLQFLLFLFFLSTLGILHCTLSFLA